MSPDWASKPTAVPYAEFGDPQSLNLYAYVRNSPIVRVDADGHGYVFQPFQSFGDDDGGSNIESSHNRIANDSPSGDTPFRGIATTHLEGNTLIVSSPGNSDADDTASAEDIAAGNFIRVGERPLLAGGGADHWYHTYLEIPEVKDGKWTGKFNTYGVLGDEGGRKNQQVRANDHRNTDKLRSNRNFHYDVRVSAAQRVALEKGAQYWSHWELPGHQCPVCGSRYILGGPVSARGGYNSNTWVYNMLIHNPAGRIEPPAIRPSPGWGVNDVGHNYYPD
jgi:hypothetical protein